MKHYDIRIHQNRHMIKNQDYELNVHMHLIDAGITRSQKWYSAPVVAGDS